MPRVPLDFPLGGLSDDDGFSAQRPGTSRLARNVRAIDPTNGRTRGAQRAGMSTFISSALSSGNKVQALASVSYDRPKVEWTELTENDNGTTEPGSITAEWSRLTPGEYSTDGASTAEVPWIETHESRVYALEAGGTIQVYNSAGTLLKAIPIPVDDVDSLLRKIIVDSEGRIYAAGASADGDVGGKVWQWKLLDEDEDLYALKWTLDLDGTPQNFDVRLGVLSVAMDFEEGDSFSKIRTYQGLHTSSPYEVWEKACPNPIRGVHIDKSGNVFTTHPSNALRGQKPGEEGFVDSSNADAWTVHDIGLEAGGSPADGPDNARYRLYANLMADRVSAADGEFVTALRDHRFIWTRERDPAGNQPPGSTDNPVEYIDVDDDEANRLLRIFPNVSRRPGPRFRLSGAGPNPSLHFRGAREKDLDGEVMEKPGMYLRSFANVHNSFKSDTTLSDDIPDEEGTNPFQRSIIPGHSTGHNSNDGWGNAWVICQVWRIPSKDNKIEVLWTQNGDPVKYALLANCTITNGELTPKRDSIVFLCNRMTEGEDVNWEGDNWQGVDANMAPGSGTDIDGYYENPADMAVITIGHAGWDWDGLDDPAGPQTSPDSFTSQSYLRVNGGAKKAFTMTQMASYGDNSFCVIGNPHWKPEPHPSDLFYDAPFEVHPFTGEFCQHVCVLGDTTTVANDTMVTRPGHVGGNPYQNDGTIPTANGASGTVDITTWSDPPTHANTNDASVVEQLEGWLAHRWAVPHILPNGLGGTGTGGMYKDHPFGGSTNPPLGYASGIVDLTASELALRSTRPILAKWGANAGALRWAINGSGLGNGVVTDSDRGVFTVGEYDSLDTGSTNDVGNTDVEARKTIDLGTSASVDDADGAWAIQGGATAPNFKYPCLRVDANDDFYWAIGASRQLRKYSGSAVDTSSEDPTKLWTYKVPASGYKMRGFAFDPNIPVYDDTSIKGPAFIYVGSTGDAEENASGGVEVHTLVKIRVVAEKQVIGDSASPRDTRYIGVANGNIYSFTRGGTASIPTGGSSAFEADSPYVQLAVFNRKVYGVDGKNTIEYDSLTNEAAALEAIDAGEVPQRAKLVTTWGGRLVLARTSDSDTNWYMSKMGNAKKWDYFPSVPRVTDAVSGSSKRGPGVNPDIITALIPATDDILYMGGDHTIHRFVGNPLDGGRLDLVSDQTGIAFGSSWAKDRQGTIYFFGQVGSIWALTQGGAERISVHAIERRFQDINLLQYRIGMAWDWRDEGLRVFQLPYGSGGVAVPGYFWDKKHNAWFEDTFDSTAVQPTAISVFDGDNPGDRVVAIGCEDGKVRYFDRTAVDDDGQRIDSRVVLGPFASDGIEMRFSQLQVALASEQSGCRYRWYVSDSPDADLERLTPAAEGELSTGLNPVLYKKARGLYTWLELRNAESTRWAFERASMMVSPGGRSRVRR